MRQLNYKKLVSEIEFWIKTYIESSNANGIVLGMSGGIDSAVVAALCKNALGKNNVLGLILPIESISEDIEDAQLVSKHLGIPYKLLDLTNVYKELLIQLAPEFKENQLALANIKPRLRMTTIYATAQNKGYLVAGTGNRSEIAIGYFTKYGDGGADLEPIASLYKNEVRKIATLLNIPQKIIIKPPSAGLWKGQTDEGEIGMKYDTLDEILYRIDYNLDLEGLNLGEIELVKKKMKSAEHKNTLPPIYKIP